jgi:hypothetical protein
MEEKSETGVNFFYTGKRWYCRYKQEWNKSEHTEFYEYTQAGVDIVPLNRS